VATENVAAGGLASRNGCAVIVNVTGTTCDGLPDPGELITSDPR
jgi:hypothetical protein